MARINKKYRVELGQNLFDIIDIPANRLIELIPVITRDNMGEWLNKAKVLTSRDFKIELRQAKGLVSADDEHQHHFDTYHICKDCGTKITANEKDAIEEEV